MGKIQNKEVPQGMPKEGSLLINYLNNKKLKNEWGPNERRNLVKWEIPGP